MTWPDTTLANAACTRSITEIVPGAALHLSSELQPFVSHTTGLHCSLGLHTRDCRMDPIHIPVQDTTVQCAPSCFSIFHFIQHTAEVSVCKCVENVCGERQQLAGRKDFKCAQNPVCVQDKPRLSLSLQQTNTPST